MLLDQMSVGKQSYNAKTADVNIVVSMTEKKWRG